MSYFSNSLEPTAPIRVGLIGCGGHSRGNHGPACRDVRVNPDHPLDPTGGLELAACCDLREDVAAQYAADFGFARHYTHLPTMLAAEELDAIIAVTPMSLTYEMTIRLMETGLPLLVEKPTAETLGQAYDLAERAEAVDYPVMVSLNRRFQGSVIGAHAMREHWDHGPLILEGTMTRVKRAHEPRFPYDTGIHLVDTMQALLGGREAIMDSLRCRYLPIAGGAWTATLDFADGSQARCQICPESGQHTETYRIFSADTELLVDTVSDEVRLFTAGMQTGHKAPASADEPLHVRNGTAGETLAFMDLVRTRRAPWPSLRDAANAMTICEAMLNAKPD